MATEPPITDANSYNDLTPTSHDMELTPTQEEPNGDDEVDSWQVPFVQPQGRLQRPLRRLTVPELLAVRQGYGASQLALPPFARPRTITTSELASKIAWNPSRLQNMILTVGPGTPAAIVDLTIDAVPAPLEGATRPRPQEQDGHSSSDSNGCQSSSSSSSSSASEEEDDDNDDDDDDDDDERYHNADEDKNDGELREGQDKNKMQEEPRTTPDVEVKEKSNPSPPTFSRSGSSSGSSSSPKRTLSDRMKGTEEDTNLDEKKKKHAHSSACDMNLDSTDDDGDEDIGDEDDNSKDHDHDDNDDDGTSAKRKEESCKKAKASSGGELTVHADAESHLTKQETPGPEPGEGNREEKPLQTTESLHSFDANVAEEHRMQFSEDEDNCKGDEETQNDEGQENEAERAGATGEGDNEHDDDAEMAEFREMAAEWFAQAQEAGGDDDGGGDDDVDESDDDESEDERSSVARIIIRRRLIQRSQSPPRRSHGNQNIRRTMKPSLRHGGCINTAAWLDAGWRLSTTSMDHYSTSYNANMEDSQYLRAISSEDCPTQLATSGDDRQVKFWDVRHAMGIANPLPWGSNTHCPFAHEPETIDTEGNSAGYKARWRDFYSRQQTPVEPWKIAGNVLPLATLHTGHRGNVFHVTPLWQQPGKVATCGADGYLRLGDVEAAFSGESNSTSIIISPEYFDEGDHMMRGLFSLRPGMCFSHHFLNTNVGLLCSERGLRRFDVRLPPRQQERRALMNGNATCKACAIWTFSSAASVEEVDSTYVFVGGTGETVALCDLRMTGRDGLSDNSKIVCQYRPRSLVGNEEVSVSGIDLSKDRKELLVSYESDQIYTFPIFPNAKSAAGPTLEEIEGLGVYDEDNLATNGSTSLLHGGDQRRTGEDIYFNELAAYGGHLNRFTFLKNAKYAGPNDEYICTGSDSGHAWIYERATGAVVSLLNADHSTCNGVIPHPSLPIFITYGIDSTAKLWRGTGPVDVNTDDSSRGRAKAFRESPYEMSSLTRDWDNIEQELSNIEQELAEVDAARNDDDDIANQASGSKSYNILPDQVLSRKELVSTGRLGRSMLRYTSGGAGGSRIGNELRSLPDVLRRNQYECIRAAVGGGTGRGSDLPVESDMKALMQRVSLIRLRHQADRQGLSAKWNPRLPWIIGTPKDTVAVDEEEDCDVQETTREAHPADLVPDNPSDWIPYDPEMSPDANPCGMSFNTKEYGDFYRERYLHSDAQGGTDEVECTLGRAQPRASTDPEASSSASENAYRILHETARVLKDGGNEALRCGDLDVAARRYDKAIRYCSIAFMSHRAASTYGGKYEDELTLISTKMLELDIDSDHAVTPLMLKWSPLLKVLISTRLNLSMLLLKQAKNEAELSQLEQARDQARHALRELQPFCTKKGSVCMLIMKSGSVARLCSSTLTGKGKLKTEVLKSKEPEETYREAKTLEAKAFFRLGSAQFGMGEYAEAVKSFDKSIECTLELNPDAKVDPLVVRRLNEAKREKTRQNKRQRKKFRMMFGQEIKSKKDKKKGDCTSRINKKDTSRRYTTVFPGPSVVAPTNDDRGTQSE